jgi:hypothetical protein
MVGSHGHAPAARRRGRRVALGSRCGRRAARGRAASPRPRPGSSASRTTARTPPASAGAGLRRTRVQRAPARESPVVATVVAGSGGWLLDVSDRAPGRMPAPAVDRDPAQGGMGLHLVARLSVAHGLVRRRRGQARLGLPAHHREKAAARDGIAVLTPRPPAARGQRGVTRRCRELLPGRGVVRGRQSYGRTSEIAPCRSQDCDREVEPVKPGQHAAIVAGTQSSPGDELVQLRVRRPGC